MESREHSYASEQPAMKIGDLVVISENAGVQERFCGKCGIIVGDKCGMAKHYGQDRAWQVLVEEIILPLVFTDELCILE